jgi:serralysin
MATKPTYTTSQITTQLTTSWGGTLTGYQFTWLSPSTTPITYSINTVTPTNSGIAPGEGGASLVAMTPTQVTTARLAFQLWADLMAKPLVESTNNPAANITLDYSSNTGNSTYTRPNGIINSSASSVSLTSAQVWMATTWSTNADSGMALGAYGLLTMIHEIGHALGISHPGTYNAGSGGTITYATNAVFAQDNRQYTVMSYFGGYLPGSGWQQDGTTLTYIYPQTPMVYDIAAIQFKYGANMTTRTDNTTYGFNSNVIGIEAAIYDFKINKTPILTIWDAGGVDTLDLSGSAANQNIDLTPGAYSSVDGMTNNVAIAFGTTIERAIGGVGNDTLTGGSSSSFLDGGAGNDLYIIKLAGDHTSSNLIQDFAGTKDEIRFTSTIASTLTLNSADTGIELVTIGTGTAATAVSTGTTALNIDASALKSAVTIVGNSGANNLIGGSGNDTIVGGAGRDTLTGGGGADYFVFNTTLSTTANLDLITDFQTGTDHLQLSKSIFQAFKSISTLITDYLYIDTITTTATAHGVSNYLIYMTQTGGLYYDSDGSNGTVKPIEITVMGSINHPNSIALADIQLVA